MIGRELECRFIAFHGLGLVATAFGTHAKAIPCRRTTRVGADSRLIAGPRVLISAELHVAMAQSDAYSGQRLIVRDRHAQGIDSLLVSPGVVIDLADSPVFLRIIVRPDAVPVDANKDCRQHCQSRTADNAPCAMADNVRNRYHPHPRNRNKPDYHRQSQATADEEQNDRCGEGRDVEQQQHRLCFQLWNHGGNTEHCQTDDQSVAQRQNPQQS